MRGFICLLAAALSLAFHSAQVEAGCIAYKEGTVDGCTEHDVHESMVIHAAKICGCGDGGVGTRYGEVFNWTAPGCQLHKVEYEFEDSAGDGTPDSCKNDATTECRDAIQQWAENFPDTCKISTQPLRLREGFSGVPPRLTTGAWALRLAENCPTGSIERISAPTEEAADQEKKLNVVMLRAAEAEEKIKKKILDIKKSIAEKENDMADIKRNILEVEQFTALVKRNIAIVQYNQLGNSIPVPPLPNIGQSHE